MRRFANIIGFACTLLLTFQIAANAAEELGAPPPEPAGTILRPVTGDSIRAELDQRLADDFSAAAGSSPYLTAEQAKKSGWGFIARNFAAIDLHKRGYVKIEEIQAFMDARAPGEPAAARARVNAAKSSIQKIK